MTRSLPARSEVDKRFTWDSESVFADDAGWEKAVGDIAKSLPDLAEFKGHLGDSPDALARAIQKAREVAGRTGAGRTEARSIHVLFALCQESGTAAHRALVQCGTDVTRLRVASMQLAMGLGVLAINVVVYALVLRVVRRST